MSFVSFMYQLWVKPILMMITLMMIMMMIMMMILVMIMMTKPYDYHDDTDDDHVRRALFVVRTQAC